MQVLPSLAWTRGNALFPLLGRTNTRGAAFHMRQCEDMSWTIEYIQPQIVGGVAERLQPTNYRGVAEWLQHTTTHAYSVCCKSMLKID